MIVEKGYILGNNFPGWEEVNFLGAGQFSGWLSSREGDFLARKLQWSNLPWGSFPSTKETTVTFMFQ